VRSDADEIISPHRNPDQVRACALVRSRAMIDTSYMRAWHLVLVLLTGCGANGAGSPKTPDRDREPEARRSLSSTEVAPASVANSGSSDGVTCEQAQAQNVEEMNLQGGGQRDLTAAEFGEVLNNGTYLVACDVPPTSHVQICAAVQNGVAVGVTVSLDPPNPEIEICVSKQVRALVFASHPKMDITRVRF
jgi:hypothetical protein